MEPDDDPLALLLEQDAALAKPPEELITIAQIDTDLVHHIAKILESSGGRRNERSSGNPFTTGVLSYVDNLNSEERRTALGILPSDAAAFIAVASTLRKKGMEIKSTTTTNAAGYLTQAAIMHSKRTRRIISLNKLGIEPEEDDDGAVVAPPTTINQRERYYQLQPNSLISASIIAPLVVPLEERVKVVNSKDELFDLVAISLSLESLSPIAARILKEETLDTGNFVSAMVDRALLYLGKKEGYFMDKSIDQVISLERGVRKERSTFVLEFQKDWTKVAEDITDYQSLARKMALSLFERKRITFNVPEISDKEEYDEFLKSLRELKIDFYKPVSERQKRMILNKEVHLPPFAFTVKNLGDERNYRSEDFNLDDLPLGSVVEVEQYDPELKRLYVETSYDGGNLDVAEVLFLQEYDVPKLLIPGRRGEIISDKDYSISKKGSWGKVLWEDDFDIQIEFQWFPNDHLTPQTYKVKKRDVKITDINEKEVVKARTKFEKETKGLLQSLETVITDVTTEHDLLQNKRRKVVAEGIDALKRFEVPEQLIAVLLRDYFEVAEDFLISENFFDNAQAAAFYDDLRLIGQDNFRDLVSKIQKEIQKELGIFVSLTETDYTQRGYREIKDNIRSFVFERVYNLGENIGKSGSLNNGSIVLLLEEHDSIPIGTVGIYRQHCYDTDKKAHIDFSPFYNREACVPVSRLRSAKRVIDPDDSFNLLLRKGAKVRIRKDSQYYGQFEGVGTLQEDFSTEGKEHRQVLFGKGKNGYRKRDLELVDPRENLKGDKLERYTQALTEFESETRGMVVDITTIIERVEQDYFNRSERVVGLSHLLVDHLRTFGASEEKIRQLFTNQGINTSYLEEKGIF